MRHGLDRLPPHNPIIFINTVEIYPLQNSCILDQNHDDYSLLQAKTTASEIYMDLPYSYPLPCFVSLELLAWVSDPQRAISSMEIVVLWLTAIAN